MEDRQQALADQKFIQHRQRQLLGFPFGVTDEGVHFPQNHERSPPNAKVVHQVADLPLHVAWRKPPSAQHCTDGVAQPPGAPLLMRQPPVLAIKADTDQRVPHNRADRRVQHEAGLDKFRLQSL